MESKKQCENCMKLEKQLQQVQTLAKIWAEKVQRMMNEAIR